MLLAALLIAIAPGFAVTARERAIDAVSQLGGPPASQDIAVVDIDDAAIQSEGPWPWPRERIAQLLDRVAQGKPAVIALDIVLSGHCGADLPGNSALAAAIARGPVTLGFVLPGADAAPSPKAAVLIRPPVDQALLWTAEVAEMPCPEFIAAAQGLGAVSLAGDDTAMVRSVPALVGIGQDLLPGLAVDAVRLKAEAGTLMLSGSGDALLQIGGVLSHPDRGGELRFRASSPSTWAARTISARTVFEAPPDLTGKIVLIGASLAQLGATRPTAATPLTPATQIQADVVAGLLDGTLPWRPRMSPLAEILGLLLGGALVTAAALRLRPGLAAFAIVLLTGLVSAAAAAAYHIAGLALDPLLPALGVAATGLAAGLSQYSASRNAEASIRRSFEQRLPPAVVAELARNGGSLSMAREERVITALFTDIEGFTALTSSAGPRELARLLDGYFEGVTGLVTAHGGMVDKIVGDAVHAFFNMPLSLPGHESKALACAEAIHRFSEDYRNQPSVKAFGFGRTRIGVETGPALVGDVGAAGKFDYSAHGDAVNLAARLQDANKRTGTSILAGPGIVSAAPVGWDFQSRGKLDMAGMGLVEVFVPVSR